MNEVEKASRDMLAALVLDYHRSSNELPDLAELATRYQLKIPTYLLESSIRPWEDLGWLIVGRSDDVSARINSDFYGEAHARLLQYLDATSLAIYWSNTEIVTDARDYLWLPTGDGWKIMQFERPEQAPAQAAAASPIGHSVINIQNTVAPIFNTGLSDGEPSAARSQASASWFNGWIAFGSLIVAAAAVAVSLRAAGII